MPKQKTHKGMQKRIKVTASGKVKCKRCNGSHLMSGKDAKNRRHIASPALLTGANAKNAIRGLCR